MTAHSASLTVSSGRSRRGFPAYGIERPLANIVAWGGNELIEEVTRDTAYRGPILIYGGRFDEETLGIYLTRLAEFGHAQRIETQRSARWTGLPPRM